MVCFFTKASFGIKVFLKQFLERIALEFVNSFPERS
mgnify:CR=1 FL=1|jgi:hypothetical protein